MKNTSGKKVNRTNNKNVETPYNYRTTQHGKFTFTTASRAAVWMLKRTNLTQSEIARRLGVSQPCVCQLARNIK